MAPETGTALTSLGDCLRGARETRGLTLEQAAEFSGISKSHLSRLESSERQPSVASLLALSDAFGVPGRRPLRGNPRASAPSTISQPDEPRQESKGLAIAACSGYSGSSVIDALRVTVEPDRRRPGPGAPPRRGVDLRPQRNAPARVRRRGPFPRTRARPSTSTPSYPIASAPKRSTAEVLLVAAKPTRNLHTKSTSTPGGTMTITDVTHHRRHREPPSNWTASWPSGPAPARPST